MKKGILISAIALLISAGVSAQEVTGTQVKTKSQQRIEARQQARAEKRIQAMEQSGDPIMTRSRAKRQNQGAVVSETARGTQSGQGQGQAVSTQARMKGESQKARVKSNNAARANKNNVNRPAVAPGKGAGRR